jgi:glutamate-1-semialdehyde 2,1-aminomutase
MGTMFATFFTDQPVFDWDSASQSDTDKYGRYFHAMLEQGTYLAPS